MIIEKNQLCHLYSWKDYKIEQNVKFTNNLDESHIDESVVNLENSVKALEKESFKSPQCKSKHAMSIDTN